MAVAESDNIEAGVIAKGSIEAERKYWRRFYIFELNFLLKHLSVPFSLFIM
jgi:hypothetical protein